MAKASRTKKSKQSVAKKASAAIRIEDLKPLTYTEEELQQLTEGRKAIPLDGRTIPMEEARRLGLLPDDIPLQRDVLGEVQRVASVEAQIGVDGELFHSRESEEPLLLTLPPLPFLTELVQLPVRYFISATITFFTAGYQQIQVAGVRTLSDDQLDSIEEHIEDLFEDQIQTAGEKLNPDWDGLPAKIALTINTINRL
ncbi:MAG TPA: hypothetical protein VGM31_14310 [Puia sp.]|jgi:hypothetical protein